MAATVAEVTVEALPKFFVSQLTALFGQGCTQRLLRGKYGITAFELLEPLAPVSPRKVCVVSHGLGACHGKFDDPIIQALLQGGYTVLAWSFYGHGWSLAGDEVLGGGKCCCGPIFNYTAAVFLKQMEELLGHVMQTDEVIDLWVGHSTGAVVGTYVASTGVWPIRNFAFISPAFWAEKPCLSKFIERFNCLIALVSNTSLIKAGEVDYLKNAQNSFGKDKSGKFLFPVAQKEHCDRIVKNFAHHPQLINTIAGISMTFLVSDQMATHRSALKEVLQSSACERVLLVWGTCDTVVPYKNSAELVAMNPQKVTLKSPELGHDSPWENAGMLGEIIVGEMNN